MVSDQEGLTPPNSLAEKEQAGIRDGLVSGLQRHVAGDQRLEGGPNGWFEDQETRTADP
jgi:hypothetical protein